jgi:NAD(P)-dependent dehydrogenase (short-subunit alcohol dehydrogenase family)
MELKDSVFVVTGGGNGIGRQVVLGLLAQGARVAALDLSEVGLKETATQAEAGDRLSTHVVNVADRAAVLALPAAVLAAHGQVDGLINVAGVVHDFKPVADLTFETIERVMAVNFWGTVNTSKAFLPLLTARPGASLVNVASMGALVPFPGQSAYGASKAAVKLFTEGLIAEHEGTPLRVSVVFPGAIDTHIMNNSGVAWTGAPVASGAKLTSPEAAARQIIEAARSGRPRVTIGGDARMLDRLSRLMPVRAIPMIAKKMRALFE